MRSRSRGKEEKKRRRLQRRFFPPSSPLLFQNSRVLAAVEAACLDDILGVADAAGEGRDGLLLCGRRRPHVHRRRRAVAFQRAVARRAPFAAEKKMEASPAHADVHSCRLGVEEKNDLPPFSNVRLLRRGLALGAEGAAAAAAAVASSSLLVSSQAREEAAEERSGCGEGHKQTDLELLRVGHC